MEYRERLQCPIVREEIEAFDCILTSDAADGQAPEITVPDRFTAVPGWQDICRGCPYHEKLN